MKKIRGAFTIIELVFVILILGILAAVAVPKLSSVVSDANYASALATISSLRSAIASERAKTSVCGNSSYPQILDDAGTGTNEALFDGNATINIMQYPIYSKQNTGGWMKTTNNAAATIGYRYYISPTRTVDFTYTKATGIFDCDHTIEDCRKLTEGL
jgi:general secretion pathway protein G